MSREDIQDLKDIVAYIARTLVDEPDAVEVTAVEEGRAIGFNVQLPSHDLGKVIGRQGRTARALRALLAVRGEQNGQRYGLEIREA